MSHTPALPEQPTVQDSHVWVQHVPGVLCVSERNCVANTAALTNAGNLSASQLTMCFPNPLVVRMTRTTS